MPPSGSQTLMGGEGVTVVSAAPGHQTILRRLSELRQYCRHIFTATSTATEPESERNTLSR